MDHADALLEATIAHLQSLKDRGVRFVTADAGLLQRATQAAPSQPAIGSVSPAPASRGTLTSQSRPIVQPAAAPAARASTPVPSALATPPAELLTASASPAPALDPVAKAAAMADLRARALVCVKCPNLVVAARTQVVFGVGDINSPLMFVGEAPGADEDEQGEPFVGKAGQLLTRIIQTMGLGRDRVYIANILKCRPDTPGQSAGNRKPTPEEMATCAPWLHEQIDLIQPKVLVALGGTAVEGLLGKTLGITKLRGNWREYRGIPLMPTYHPAYLLRNQALSEKRRVWEDMLQVMEKLGLPVSAKQRNFFLTR